MASEDISVEKLRETLIATDCIDDIDEELPFEVIQNAQLASMELLPATSRDKYLRVFNVFKKWQSDRGIKTISSQVMMSYFYEMDQKHYKPTSLWAYYSMLKSTIRVKENTDIGKYAEIISYLKAKASGFKSVKAQVFTENQLKNLFDSADDLQWLDVKVVTIFGICGACRIDEFLHISPKDVEKHSDTLYLVRLNKTKTKIPRSFSITGSFVALVEKYIRLRPAHADPEGRFFVNYQRRKCTTQNMGRHKFSGMTRRIAEFLKLDNGEQYTGHSFRRTSATILANNGADMETIMRHGGWRNEKSAKGYIEDSIHYKQRTGNMIIGSILGTVECSVVTAAKETVAPIQTTNFAKMASISSVVGRAALPPPATVPMASIRNTSTDTDESYFDDDINESELISVTEHFSQQHRDTLALCNVRFDQNESGVVFTQELSSTACSKSSKQSRGPVEQFVRHDIKVQIKESDTITQQATKSVPDVFKMFGFEKIENCTFNFYTGNGKS